MNPDSLWSHSDYRVFLKNWYEKNKKAGKISFRLFSRNCGFSSPNFLKLIMEGKRNLSEEGMKKFAKGLGLNKSETLYFISLVQFNQANNTTEKITHEKRMMTTRRLGHIKPILRNQYLMYSSWLTPVVYELARGQKIDGLSSYLLKKIRPKVSLGQIDQALRVLQKLGFLSASTDGYCIPSEPVVTTGLEATSMALHEFHLSQLKLAASRLDEVPADERDFSSLTIGIPKHRISELKKKLQELRQEIVRQFASEQSADEVMVLNFQLFPVTENTNDVKITSGPL